MPLGSKLQLWGLDQFLAAFDLFLRYRESVRFSEAFAYPRVSSFLSTTSISTSTRRPPRCHQLMTRTRVSGMTRLKRGGSLKGCGQPRLVHNAFSSLFLFDQAQQRTKLQVHGRSIWSYACNRDLLSESSCRNDQRTRQTTLATNHTVLLP